jgi:ketosteroid isomerase-like protein
MPAVQDRLHFFKLSFSDRVLPVAFFLPRSKKATRSRVKKKTDALKGAKNRIGNELAAGMMVALSLTTTNHNEVRLRTPRNFKARRLTMNEDNNVKTVKDAYLAFKDHNIPALLRCLTGDVRWFLIGPPDLIPTAGTRKGCEQVEEFFATLEAIGEIQSFRPQDFVAEGDKVVAMGELQARVKSTGKLIDSPWVHVFTLRDRKISEFRSFYDSAAAVTALDGARFRAAKAETSRPRRQAIL